MSAGDERAESPEELQQHNARLREELTRLREAHAEAKARWAKVSSELTESAKNARQDRDRAREQARHQLRVSTSAKRVLQGEVATLSAALEASRARRFEGMKLAQLLVAAMDNAAHSEEERQALLQRALKKARTLVALSEAENKEAEDPKQGEPRPR